MTSCVFPWVVMIAHSLRQQSSRIVATLASHLRRKILQTRPCFREMLDNALRPPYIRIREDFIAKYKGSCYCGGVRFEVAEEPVGAFQHICQKWGPKWIDTSPQMRATATGKPRSSQCGVWETSHPYDSRNCQRWVVESRNPTFAKHNRTFPDCMELLTNGSVDPVYCVNTICDRVESSGCDYSKRRCILLERHDGSHLLQFSVSLHCISR